MTDPHVENDPAAPLECAACGKPLTDAPYDREALCFGKTGNLVAHQTWRAPVATAGSSAASAVSAVEEAREAYDDSIRARSHAFECGHCSWDEALAASDAAFAALVAAIRAEPFAPDDDERAWRAVDYWRGMYLSVAEWAQGAPPSGAEAVARLFHETYERLAPMFGYETRRESAVPWEDVPENNRRLMTAVAAEVIGRWAQGADAEVAPHLARAVRLLKQWDERYEANEAGRSVKNISRDTQVFLRALAGSESAGGADAEVSR